MADDNNKDESKKQISDIGRESANQLLKVLKSVNDVLKKNTEIYKDVSEQVTDQITSNAEKLINNISKQFDKQGKKLGRFIQTNIANQFIQNIGKSMSQLSDIQKATIKSIGNRFQNIKNFSDQQANLFISQQDGVYTHDESFGRRLQLQSRFQQLIQQSYLSLADTKQMFTQLNKNQGRVTEELLSKYQQINKQAIRIYQQQRDQSRQKIRLQQQILNIQQQYNISNMHRQQSQEMALNLVKYKQIGYWIQYWDNKSKQILNYTKQTTLEYSSILYNLRQMVGGQDKRSQELTRLFKQNAKQMSKYGITVQQSLDITKYLATQLGNINVITDDSIKKSGFLMQAYGYSAQQSAKLLISIAQGFNTTIQQAQEFTKTIDRFSRGAGVSTSQVFSDIAQDSQYTAKWQKQGGINIARAAVQARKYGLQLSNIAKIAQSILDFQSSVQSQLQFMLITGKQINYNKIRQLAITGQHAEMLQGVKDILIQTNPTNIWQWQSISKMTGMSVKQLQRLQLVTRKLRYLDGKGIAQQIKQGLSAQQIIANNKKYLSISQDFQRVTTAFRIATMEIVASIQPLIKRIINIAGAIANGNAKWVMWVGIIGSITSAVILFTAKLVGAFKIIRGITTLSSTSGGALQSVGSGMQSFFTNINTISIASVGKLALISAVIIGSLAGLGFALTTFANVEWKQVSIAGVALVGFIGVMTVMSLLMTKISPVLLVGAGIFAIMGASLIPFTMSISSLVKSMTTIEQLNIKDSFKNIIQSITSLYDLSKQKFKIQTISDVIKQLTAVLSDLYNIQSTNVISSLCWDLSSILHLSNQFDGVNIIDGFKNISNQILFGTNKLKQSFIDVDSIRQFTTELNKSILVIDRLYILIQRMKQNNIKSTFSQITSQIQDSSKKLSNLSQIDVAVKKLQSLNNVLMKIRQNSNINVSADAKVNISQSKKQNKQQFVTKNQFDQVISLLSQINKKQLVINLNGRKVSQILAAGV